ncbi:SWIM zinc finger family protein [Neobacillus pocheonensis]|uniref:SWIM zinc finger family protein n=1 Tax=Neobacillus pocheonensis TaxID=363869 RepID=A0ABT0WJC4_9BACI|nr:SWIM zinc finger family protein [Neobacillus pocheonensis]
MESIELQHLSNEVRELLHPHDAEDAKLVQKGLMLYRQGTVGQLHFGEDLVTATVQDVTPVKVQLDLTFLSMSECSCPYEGLCRHQMAVFFTAYAKIGSVAEWVEEWREPMKEKKEFTTWGLQTAKDLIKANGVLKPDYSRWVHSFEVSFDTLLASKKYTSPFIITELFQIYERRIHASAPVEQEWRLLYELVGIVISFKKLAVLSEQSGHTEDMVKRAYLHLFHNMMDDADDLVQKIGIQSLPFDFDEFILKLKDDAFELLTAAKGLELERVYLYRLLWSNLFKKKVWREEEAGKIRERMKLLQDWENPLPLMIAGIHLNFLLHNDEAALKMVGRVGDEVVTPYLIHWIDLFSHQKAWKRVSPVIELFLQKLKAYLEELGGYHSCSSFTKTALKAIAPFCVENGRTDLFERALLKTLPYSFADYEYMLFERGQYDRWSELQAYVGLNYYDLPKDRVKLIEKEKPEVLLGMLHQLAQREIDQKNRQSYKLAVRHLKKLRTLYKKMKRLDDWEYFFETLLDKTKRLRAFHEECRRSKLIEV